MSVVASQPPINGNGPTLQCTQQRCPIQVHWHFKANYKEYWRVKITITNFNYGMNYTHWTLVAQHSNLAIISRVYNFEYEPLNTYGSITDTGMFYGIKYHNMMLNEAVPEGIVQPEMILRKDKNTFTLAQGWPFPRKIYFNGDECTMPSPDVYPSLPNSASGKRLLSLGLALFLPTLWN
ncbi:COBRA-like protein 5 [Punica granatum]|uniref:COBRA C-terminal domain-containing protein n=2 Tax=Punica granatum TaxID=22663 RepID=A0A218XZC0_PUNGR|nr:COBRA-like protein 5 [Punica granatum]OWM90363.1 hypothetical protein CDL15_Pgr014665 [Punica granatum]PKI32478.1 hypothetical protein CRG98_047140 [Punica granatum]